MLVRMVVVVALQVLPLAGVQARDLSPDLRVLVEGFQGHRRVAIGYLRAENADLGAVEIERLRERLAADRGRLPASDAADPRLASALARVEATVAASLKAADGGEVARARRLLVEAAAPLDVWRKENGVRLFSDCIAEIAAAYERLDRYRLDRPDLGDPSVVPRIAEAADGAIAALDRCDAEAAAPMRREAEFRRLFDGMRDSLRQTPEAARERDGARLHRLLIEQRSLERLLEFRFG